MTKAELIDRLVAMIWGSPTDCVELALRGSTAGLDLSALGEYRVSSQGSVEIRIADRGAALRLLGALVSDTSNEDGASSFLAALMAEAGDCYVDD